MVRRIISDGEEEPRVAAMPVPRHVEQEPSAPAIRSRLRRIVKDDDDEESAVGGVTSAGLSALVASLRGPMLLRRPATRGMKRQEPAAVPDATGHWVTPPTRRQARSKPAAPEPETPAAPEVPEARASRLYGGLAASDGEASSASQPPAQRSRRFFEEDAPESPAKRPLRRPARAAAGNGQVKAQAAFSKDIADSEAEEWSSGDGAAQVLSTRASTRLAKQALRVAGRKVRAKDLGHDDDAEVEDWEDDLRKRRTGGLPETSSAFSSEPCNVRVVRGLPASSSLAGFPVFLANGQVSLQLLLGAHYQLQFSVGAGQVASPDVRHIGYLARLAVSLGLVTDTELQRGRARTSHSDALDEPSKLLLVAQGKELRFPSRPPAAQAAASKEKELFGDEDDPEVERFAKRQRTVDELKSRLAGRQTRITARSSHDLDLNQVRTALLAPSLSFDIQNRPENSSDEEDGLEVGAPESEMQGFGARRGLLREQLLQSWSKITAQKLGRGGSKQAMTMPGTDSQPTATELKEESQESVLQQTAQQETSEQETQPVEASECVDTAEAEVEEHIMPTEERDTHSEEVAAQPEKVAAQPEDVAVASPSGVNALSKPEADEPQPQAEHDSANAAGRKHADDLQITEDAKPLVVRRKRPRQVLGDEDELLLPVCPGSGSGSGSGCSVPPLPRIKRQRLLTEMLSKSAAGIGSMKRYRLRRLQESEPLASAGSPGGELAVDTLDHNEDEADVETETEIEDTCDADEDEQKETHLPQEICQAEAEEDRDSCGSWFSEEETTKPTEAELRELRRNRKDVLRESRQEARRLGRTLKWEAEDLQEMSGRSEALAGLCATTMSAEDRGRWASIMAQDNGNLTGWKASEPTAARQLLGSHRDDDSSLLYSFGPGKKAGSRPNFLKASRGKA